MRRLRADVDKEMVEDGRVRRGIRAEEDDRTTQEEESDRARDKKNLSLHLKPCRHLSTSMFLLIDAAPSLSAVFNPFEPLQSNVAGLERGASEMRALFVRPTRGNTFGHIRGP